MTRSSLSRTALIIALAAAASPALASGFQLKEQSAEAQGTSFAGATARGDDASTIFYNPAGMTNLDGTQFAINGSYIDPYAALNVTHVTATGTGQPNASNTHGGDISGGTIVPSVYAMTSLPNDWKLGLAINTPFGLSTSYNSQWVGRYYGVQSTLQTIDFTPTLAKKVTNELSLSGGLQIQDASARLTNAVNLPAITSGAVTHDGLAKVTGDDVGIGYVAAAMYQPVDGTSIGLDYRSRVHHELDGDIKFSNLGAASAVPALASGPAKAYLTTPDVLSLGLKQRLTDKWDLLTDVSWTNWSLFKNLTVKNKSDGAVRQNVDEGWHDTYFASVGGEYKATDKLTLRTGVAYDESPVSDSHRTVRIPDSNRFWLSGGAGYKLTDATTIDVAYTHIFGETVSVLEDTTPALNGVVDGNYHPHVDIVSAELSMKF